jgi:Mg-chelatase subunit ChlD
MPVFSKTLGLLLTVLLLLSVSATCEAQEKKKIAYGVFVDNSGSMRTQFERVIQLSKAVTDQIRGGGPVSIFDFHSQGKLQQGRAVAIARIEQTQDARLLEQSIDDLYVEGGLTTLLDAIQIMAERLSETAAGPDYSDRVIILITDGEDRKSVVRQKQLMLRLSELKIRVYAIGLVEQLESGSRSKAGDLLTAITKETGGRVVFPKSNSQDIQSILSELALPIP